jgi:AraC family transcriptional regulator
MSAQAQTLGGGSFYGAIQARQEQCGVIFTDLCHRGARKMPAHSHELPFFGLILEGDYAERYGRRQNFFGPFTAQFRPAGIPHQDEVGPRGVRFFDIEIRPAWQKRLQDCSGALNVACDDFGGGELLWIAMRLFRETRVSIAGDELNTESLIAELLAVVARMPRDTAKDTPGWLRRVVGKINAEYCRRLTLSELSAEAGVHPVHLSRVFRRHVGQGIGEYVHRLRIRAACERMLTRRMTLAEVSCDTGFADQSHFTRAFRRVTGMSPARFQRMMRSGDGSVMGTTLHRITSFHATTQMNRTIPMA